MKTIDIDLARISGGKLTGTVEITANEWETRDSWGHVAEASVNNKTIARVKFRYENRTWEAYRFQSVIQKVIVGCVDWLTGIDVCKPVCKRDTMPMKALAAEKRRIARLEAYDFAQLLAFRMKGLADGRLTYSEIENRDKLNKVESVKGAA